MKLETILQNLDELIPIQLAEEWDNVGLLVGRNGEDIQKILVCLDFSETILKQAVRENCQMVIAHHPVIFKPIRSLTHPLLLEAARQNVCVYACHTNLDMAAGGVNDVLAKKIHLQDIQSDGMLRFGVLEKPMDLQQFASHIKLCLNVPMLRICPVEKKIQRVAVLGGAGGDFIEQAVSNHCDAFLTGEASYHVAQTALDHHLVLVCAGHYETEVPVVKALSAMLQKQFPSICITEGKDVNPFPVI